MPNTIEILFQIRHHFEMECQVVKHVRHHFAFNQGHKSTKAAQDIYAVYGDDFIIDRKTISVPFYFKDGTFELTESLLTNCTC